MNDTRKKNWFFKYVSKIVSWFLLVLLILIAAFLVYYVVAANIYARKGEQFKPKFAMYTIISPSMEPTINRYDVIFNVRVDNLETLKEGDVITFISSGILNEGMTVTHRIIGIIKTEDGIKFRTQGDNNLVPDSALVEPGNVLGKTLFKIPQLGRIQSLLATRGGWIFIVLVPALGIIIYDILKLFKLIKVKNKVEKSIEDNEIKVDLEQVRREETRKEELKEKLLNSNNSLSKMNLNDGTEMPKLKQNVKTSKNNKKKTSTSKKSTTKKTKVNKNSKKKNINVIKVDVELPKKK